ncbi:MAG TPA: S41 family peptidase [Anaerolineales bacterium]|nr:S41 family peptidase [Anaerolineales bacterium]
MTPGEHTALIEDLIARLLDSYVFPEVAVELEKALRTSDFLDGLAPDELAMALTLTLQDVSKDKHLWVRYRETPYPPPQADGRPTPEEIENMRREAAAENFGFASVAILGNNLGYLDLRGFAPPQWAGPKIAAAMTLLSDTQALIIDLRNNGGGSPETVALFCSYFFPAEPIIHLNSIYNRPEDRTEDFFTIPALPAPRYLGKPVYLLTSSYTFSGAEEFAYNLKNLQRVTIVGEITGGGAHPVEFQRLMVPHFLLAIPNARAINPLTGTNWEGVGVHPHIQVPADDALDLALQKILTP